MNLIQRIQQQPLFQRLTRIKILIFGLDSLMAPTAWILAYWVRYNLEAIPQPTLDIAILTLPLITITQAFCNLFFRVYRGVWRYASISDISRIIKSAISGTTLTLILLFAYSRLHGVPRSVILIYTLLLISLMCGVRLLFRWQREHIKQHKSSIKVLIFGAGEAGEALVRKLRRNYDSGYEPLGFIDDAPHKQGQEIHGVRVLGKSSDMVSLCKKYKINHIFIAIPSVSSAKMRRVVNACEQTALPFSTLPSLNDLTSGRVSINDLREVQLEDLLGRDQISLEWKQINTALTDKTVLITGGGGSIGAELCRQIARLSVRQLIIVDNCEYNLYRIQKDLEENYPHSDVLTHLVSITDEMAIRNIMRNEKPDVVFHAAAYKHVPMLENEVPAAVKNNIMGTRYVAEAAAFTGVKKFVLISTDKAVNPTNIMGTTKRIAEIFCQNFNARCQTQFITVRFGNVLGSAGSVVPLFKKQLKQGGPLTVTHPDISRYFMTIPEASQLILQATAMGDGGEIYVLDMGEPISIRYLAEQMIRLSGKKVDEDIQIVYTGLRPGEKLFEELLHEKEKLLPTNHHKILMAHHRQLPWETLIDQLDQLQRAYTGYTKQPLIKLLKDLVPEFTHENPNSPTSLIDA